MAISRRMWWRGATLVCRVAIVVATVLPLFRDSAWAHTFVSRSEPRGGAILIEPPAQIRIWFDGPIEQLFATIRVENTDKRRVDKGDGRVSPSNNRLLEVGLPTLQPGRYRVFWGVVARDGHRREGDLAFLIR